MVLRRRRTLGAGLDGAAPVAWTQRLHQHGACISTAPAGGGEYFEGVRAPRLLAPQRFEAPLPLAPDCTSTGQFGSVGRPLSVSRGGNKHVLPIYCTF